MKLIDQVGSEPRQKHSVIIDDGTRFSFELYFVPMQLGWFFTYVEYGDFLVESVRVCNSPNLLHQFRNKIPFGIACLSTAQREPSLQQDFTSGDSALYVLTSEEVDFYERYLRGQV